MRKIGITTTVPIEILLAANVKAVDLNNDFITSSNYQHYIDIAEKDGFPKSLCAWIKGLYGVCIDNNIEEIVGVVGGDCSNTKSLVEVLETKGIKINPFSYPTNRTIEAVKTEIDLFAKMFNVDMNAVENIRRQLSEVRDIAKDIDELTYKENKATGFENHLFQIGLSDFEGDVESFQNRLVEKRDEISRRKPLNHKLRLAYIGVPPMTGDIYDFVETLDSRIVYNEVQREFAFPRHQKANNIYEQYYDYTYPYDVMFRLDEIKRQIEEREIDAVIHYTQAFCHKAIEHIVISKELDVPVLNIEGDKINKLDARTKLRLEAFLDMLLDVKGARL